MKRNLGTSIMVLAIAAGVMAGRMSVTSAKEGGAKVGAQPKVAKDKKSPQQVGKPECDEKGIGIQARAKAAGDHRIAHESQNPRHQGHAADGRQGLEQIHNRVGWMPECGGL